MRVIGRRVITRWTKIKLLRCDGAGRGRGGRDRRERTIRHRISARKQFHACVAMDRARLCSSTSKFARKKRKIAARHRSQSRIAPIGGNELKEDCAGNQENLNQVSAKRPTNRNTLVKNSRGRKRRQMQRSCVSRLETFAR